MRIFEPSTLARVVGLVLLSLLSQAPERATVHVITTPAESVISIDGELKGLAPRDEQLMPGVHTVLAELNGAQATSVTISVVAGEERTLKLELLPEHASPRPFPVAGVVTAGGGVLVLTLGLLLRIPAEAAGRQVTALYARGGGWDDAAREIEAQGLSAQTWSWFFTGAGAGITASGLIVAAVQWLAPQAPLPRLTFTPLLGGGYARWSVEW
jgi:hypothetical protein